MICVILYRELRAGEDVEARNERLGGNPPFLSGVVIQKIGEALASER